MDYGGAYAIKSDTLFDEDLRSALITAVVPLENVHESQKDWHPGSNGKVLDLVHPSLWPLVYGLSRLIPDRQISLDDALDYCGAGLIIPSPDKPDLHAPGDVFLQRSENQAVSERFQWLPCDVDLTGDQPRITSCINNLHPIDTQTFTLSLKSSSKRLFPPGILYIDQLVMSSKSAGSSKLQKLNTTAARAFVTTIASLRIGQASRTTIMKPVVVMAMNRSKGLTMSGLSKHTHLSSRT